jgi:hypothetical protein
MAKWKASFNNQCPLNWFRTQAITIGEIMNNNLTNMSCQKGWNFGCHPHWTLLVKKKH